MKIRYLHLSYLHLTGVAGQNPVETFNQDVVTHSLVQTVKAPMVLIAGHCLDSPYLRVPTLKQKLKAKKTPVTLISSTELGLENDVLMKNDKVLMALKRPQTKRPCVFLAGGNVKDQVKRLYDEYLRAVFFS